MSLNVRLIDVHTHLTHEAFKDDLPAVIERAVNAGIEAIVVNGLEPASNRMVLRLAEVYPVIKPALGIYPLDAVNDSLPSDFPFEVTKFNVDSEIDFIEARANEGKIVAVGECGLDQHYLGKDHLAGQEAVFRRLIEVAKSADIPLIVHSRNAEERTAAILKEHEVKKVNFHCFGGRTSWAKTWAEREGWWFSIPSNVTKNQAFQKMLAILPIEKILTETDAPYLAPVRGERNEPATVAGTVMMLAAARGMTFEAAAEKVFDNYLSLFSLNKP